MANGLYPELLDFESITRPKKYKPTELWKKFGEYVRDREDSPIEVVATSKTQGEGDGKKVKKNTISKNNLLTINDFVVLYLGQSISWWDKLDKGGRYASVYKIVKEKIATHIKEHKLKGATSGVFNAQVIIRDLGLADRTINETKIVHDPDADLTEEEMRAEIERLKSTEDYV